MIDAIFTVADSAPGDLRTILEIVGAIVAAILGVLGGRQSMKGKNR